jgi:capsular polysaccharide biosynthesis protein
MLGKKVKTTSDSNSQVVDVTSEDVTKGKKK